MLCLQQNYRQGTLLSLPTNNNRKRMLNSVQNKKLEAKWAYIGYIRIYAENPQIRI